jgi:hypothetical protein
LKIVEGVKMEEWEEESSGVAPKVRKYIYKRRGLKVVICEFLYYNHENQIKPFGKDTNLSVYINGKNVKMNKQQLIQYLKSKNIPIPNLSKVSF